MEASMSRSAGWLLNGSSCMATQGEDFALPVDDKTEDRESSLFYITPPLLPSLSERQRVLGLICASGKHACCVRTSATVLALAYTNSPSGRLMMRDLVGEVVVLVLEIGKGYYSASFVRASAAADAFCSGGDVGAEVSMTLRAESMAARLVDSGNDALRLMLQECCDKQTQLVSRNSLRRPTLLHNGNDGLTPSPDGFSGPNIILHWREDASSGSLLPAEALRLFPGAAIAEAPAGHAAFAGGLSFAKGAADRPSNNHLFGSVHEFCVGIFVSVNGSPGNDDGVAWLIGSCCSKLWSNSNVAEVFLLHREDDTSLIDLFLVPVNNYDFTETSTINSVPPQKPIHTFRVPSHVDARAVVVQHLPLGGGIKAVAEVSSLVAAHPLLVSIDCRGGALAVTARRLLNFRRTARARMLWELLAAAVPIAIRTGLVVAFATGAAVLYDNLFRKAASLIVN